MFNETITHTIDGSEYTLKAKLMPDNDHGAPWENEDGHGVISDWVSRDKNPSELVLNEDGTAQRFYDYAATCELALADGWDSAPYNNGSETPKQQAAKAARADYYRMKAWCDDEWHYVGVVVTLLDCDGEETGITESLWGIESDAGEYLNDTAGELADEVMAGRNSVWVETIKTTFTTI